MPVWAVSPFWYPLICLLEGMVDLYDFTPPCSNLNVEHLLHSAMLFGISSLFLPLEGEQLGVTSSS